MDGTNQTNQPLDPSVVALTKAIGQAESGGNYGSPDKTGDNAGSYGAYQMTPGFIQEYAPKILGSYDPNQPLTPEQQDQLAYGVVKEWGTNGDSNHPEDGPLTPAQVSSAWNTGDPNAYLDPTYGKNNTYGSTANYVNKISETYNKNLSAQNITTPTTSNKPQESKLWENIVNGVLGVGAAGMGYVSSHSGALTNLAEKGAMAAGTIAIGGGPEDPLADALAIGEIASAVPGLFGPGDTGKGGGTTTNSAAPQEPNNINPIPQSTPQESQVNSAKLSESIIQAMQGTVGGRTQLQDPQIQAGIHAIGQFGLAPEIDENGAMDFSQAQKKNQQIVGGLNQQVVEMLNQEDSHGSFSEMSSDAKRMAHTRLPETEWADADKAIDETVATYKQNSGDSNSAPLSRFHKIKIEQGHGRKWEHTETNARREAMKHLSTAAKKQILKNTKNKELYEATLKMERRLINGEKVMKRLNGKKSPKNTSLKKTILQDLGKAGASYIGDKIGGPVGAIIGYMMARHIEGAVEKKYGKIIFESPAVRHAINHLKGTSPAAYKIITERLKKEGISIKELMKEDGKVPMGKLKQNLQKKGLLQDLIKKHNEASISKIPTPITPNKPKNNNKRNRHNKRRKH